MDTISNQFPAGLRVLLVDDDIICLKILETMLRRCSYHVTTCHQATAALKLLREQKGWYDVVLSDLHMPDINGFKLLELVGLEMNLPVIMMSADGRTDIVLRGIKHGACDYMIKPIREEQLKCIWQHVVRKNLNKKKEIESVYDKDKSLRLKKRKSIINLEEDDDEVETGDRSGSSKEPRVVYVWSVEVHKKFVSVVNQLGIEKATSKRILKLMNVPGLTRKIIASHLERYKLPIMKISGVTQQAPKLGSYGGSAIQSLMTSGQNSLLTLAPPQPAISVNNPAISQVEEAIDAVSE